MTKSYADICLERADKATDGPWNSAMLHSNVIVEISKRTYWTTEYNDTEDFRDSEFIAHARTDVPELAARVNETVEWLRRLASTLKRGLPISYEVVQDFADELEAMPEGEGRQ